MKELVVVQCLEVDTTNTSYYGIVISIKSCTYLLILFVFYKKCCGEMLSHRKCSHHRNLLTCAKPLLNAKFGIEYRTLLCIWRYGSICTQHQISPNTGIKVLYRTIRCGPYAEIRYGVHNRLGAQRVGYALGTIRVWYEWLSRSGRFLSYRCWCSLCDRLSCNRIKTLPLPLQIRSVIGRWRMRE